jgi:hypothetical protein
MSTRIEDLPGPSPSKTQSVPMQPPSPPQQFQQPVVSQIPPSLQNQPPLPQNNITMDVKKKTVTQELVSQMQSPGLLASLKNEINEENLLLLVFIVIACSPQTNNYLYNIPSIGNYITGTSLFSIVLKSALLLFVFILSKLYLLPHLRL